MSAAAELEELALPLPVPLDLRVIATPHALAMARDLAGLALPAGSTVQGVDVTLAEWHVGHRLEVHIPTPAGMCRAELERRQLTDEHPVTWELTYRQRTGVRTGVPHRAAITPEGDVYAGLTYPKE